MRLPSIRTWQRPALLFIAWTLLSAFLASQAYVTALYTSQAEVARRIFGLSLVQWELWGVLALAIAALTRRFPIERPRLVAHLALHVVVSLSIDFGKVLLDVFVARKFFGLPHPAGGSVYHVNFLTYWAIVAIAQGATYYTKYRERESQLTEARMQMLHAQLHPHFLFNTLQAISTLLHKDPVAADRMLIRLSDLLRASLDQSGLQKNALAREVAFLDAYLGIERERLRDRLIVQIEIADDVRHALVPYLLLVPLAENAILHGIAPRATPGHIRIAASRTRDLLSIVVEDDGLGMPVNPRNGIGLGNTRVRLDNLYGAEHTFNARNRESGGVSVRITIPFERATHAN